MTTANTRQGPVKSIIASAGTGKTFSLVQHIRDDISAGLEPARVLATTFTKKAAAELEARLRTELIRVGDTEAASGLLASRIGTVNGVCGELIADFALELGRSPVAEVISDDRVKTAFYRATGAVMSRHVDGIADVAERLSIPDVGYEFAGGYATGWSDTVQAIVNQARLNGIPATHLDACATYSLAGLLELLPEADDDATSEALDRRLMAAVSQCVAALTPGVRSTFKKTTQKAVSDVEAALRESRGPIGLSWRTWVALSKVSPAKADEHLFQDVVQAASSFPGHPRLRADLAAFVERIFACAADCLDAFDEYKSERGFVDFVDQERLALEILRDPANVERLQESIRAVFVDEYQDSSPIQLAVFSALSQVAERSVWVGDPKQAIYAFRDADPELSMETARQITRESRGDTGFLRTSYRSRQPIAEFVNAAFGPGFTALGASKEEVEFEGCDRREAADAAPAFGVWTLKGSNKTVRAQQLAASVLHCLTSEEDWSIEERDGPTRPLRGGDIAVLCRSNGDVRGVAEALAALGIRVSIERQGLLQQLEVQTVIAALRFVADPSDSLAAAELARFLSSDGAWLEAAFAEDAETALAACIPFQSALKDLRTSTAELTPAEMLDSVLRVDGLLSSIRGWGDIESRFANLEVLRSLAEEYQSTERAERRAVTLTGFCTWLAGGDGAQPASLHPDAVHVMTYHGSKGLEWPMVVLTGLDGGPRANPFALEALSTTKPDWRNPLANRVLRYWPWPFGSQEKDGFLEGAAAESPAGQAARQKELAERRRLLYVGATRARDYVVFTTTGRTDTWLEELTGADGHPLVKLNDPGSVWAGDVSFDARHLHLDEDAGRDVTPFSPPPEFAPPRAERQVRQPLLLRPSAGTAAEVRASSESVVLGARLPLPGAPDMQRLGEAIHRFLAADDQSLGRETRLASAGEHLTRWGVPEFQPHLLIEAADRLWGFLQQRYAEVEFMREWPVVAEVGEQVINGRMDLLIDLGDSFALIDHKSFPGGMERDPERLTAVLGQAGLYSVALRIATGKPLTEFWVHQPTVGILTRFPVGVGR